MSGEAIVLTNLTKSYGKRRGIENLSFSVQEGEFFGFIGPNGAGKSTTIRTLMGLLRPTGGRAEIFGLDCQEKASVIAKDTGYLPGEGGYYSDMKVRDFLRYTEELYKKDCGVKKEELAERLSLDLSRKISALSLGNRKKVGIVSALMTSPKLILMDEPTSGLDPFIQQAFYEILKEENRRGATIFFSSHVLSEVQKLCGRVAILKEGKLLGVQSIRDLRESGYKKITVAVKDPVPKDFFNLPGIADYQEGDGGRVASFIYSGAVSEMVEKLRLLPLVDVTMEEPSLEEIFFHYYE